MSGLAIQLRGVAPIVVPAEFPQNELCSCLYCDWEEYAFAGDAEHKKDMNSFLARKLSASDTISFVLEKDGVEVATITDNSYGTYYSTFTAQPLYAGWVADWTLIYNAFGAGRYQVIINATLAGASLQFPSHFFRVLPYNARIAHRTWKLEAYQTGNIIGNDLDYTGLLPGGWYQSRRVTGILEPPQAVLEQDDYLDTTYTLTQNRTSVAFEYSATAENVPHSIFVDLARDKLLGNTLFLTDYNMQADIVYRRLPVALSAFDEVNHLPNGRGVYRFRFVDRQPDTIKRNF